MDRERVAWLSTLDVERASQRIRSRGLYPGVFKGMAIGVDGIGFENISRLQAQHGSRDPVVVLELPQLELISSDMRLLCDCRKYRRGKTENHQNDRTYNVIHDFS